MQLPAIREKIAQLPRIYKVLFLTLLVAFLALITEGSYYFWVTRKVTEESKLINNETTYQEGAYLHDRQTEEIIAIRGRVVKIDGWFLTIENQGNQVSVEIDKGFEFSELNEPPATDQVKLNLDRKWNSAEEMIEVLEEEAIQKGLLIRSYHPEIDDLNQILNVGQFIVISGLDRSSNNERFKGKILSVLKFLK